MINVDLDLGYCWVRGGATGRCHQESMKIPEGEKCVEEGWTPVCSLRRGGGQTEVL